MKNISKLFVAAIVLVFAFTSCQKEGVYNPSKKINRIYYSSKYLYEEYINDSWQTMYSDESPKHVSEVWNWDGKLLKEIKYYDSDGSLDYTTSFSYDGKKISSITYGESRKWNFKYKGSKLENIEVFYENELVEKISIEHDGSKISKMKFTEYDNDKKGSNMMPKEVLRFIIPNADSQSFEKAMARMQKMHEMKSEYSWVYSLEWDGDNVKKMTYLSDDLNADTEFSYDNKKNPYYGLFMTEDVDFLSKNNVTYERVAYSDGDIDENNYEYTYNGKYPETKFGTWKNANGNFRYTGSYNYYYEYK